VQCMWQMCNVRSAVVAESSCVPMQTGGYRCTCSWQSPGCLGPQQQPGTASCKFFSVLILLRSVIVCSDCVEMPAWAQKQNNRPDQPAASTQAVRSRLPSVDPERMKFLP
jgi:hypothetical protein